MLEKNPKPSEEEVESALAQVHINRYERAVDLVSQAHELQMIMTGRSPVSKLVTEFLMPILGPEAFLKIAIPIAAASHRIKRLPVPKRFRIVPFNDELPAPPITNKAAYWVPWILTIGCLAVLLYQTAQASTCVAIADSFRAVQALLPNPQGDLHASRKLVASVISAENTVETIRLRTNLFTTLTLWLVEGNRHGNQLAVITW